MTSPGIFPQAGPGNRELSATSPKPPEKFHGGRAVPAGDRSIMNREHKVIITGTGRAGTTFLVRLLTELGLDTGFTPAEARAGVDARSHAGLEHQLAQEPSVPRVRDWLCRPKRAMRTFWRSAERTPYIIKNPALCDHLAEVIASGRVVIDHVYIPLRDLDEAALSRVRVGGADGSQPGGLWKTDDADRQKAVLAEMFFRLIHTLARHDIPHTFLLFPRLVDDWAYTHHKLWFLVKDLDAEKFRTTFAYVADRRLIHEFAAKPAGRAPTPAVAPKRTAQPGFGVSGVPALAH